jgi:hypothetical protein
MPEAEHFRMAMERALRNYYQTIFAGAGGKYLIIRRLRRCEDLRELRRCAKNYPAANAPASYPFVHWLDYGRPGVFAALRQVEVCRSESSL